MKELYATEVVGLGVAVEYRVHYILFGFLRVSPVRYREDGLEIQYIPTRQRRREWVRRDNVGFFRLEGLNGT